MTCGLPPAHTQRGLPSKIGRRCLVISRAIGLRMQPLSILGHESLKKHIPVAPFTISTVGIDMPRLADIDERAHPSNCTMFGVGQRSERVIRAGDHETPKSKRF